MRVEYKHAGLVNTTVNECVMHLTSCMYLAHHELES